MSLRMDSSRTFLTTRDEGWGLWWTRRNRTEKQLLFTLFIFAMLSLVLIIAVAVLASRNASEETKDHIGPDKGEPVRICTTPDCVRAAQILMDMMNETVDPCKDFYAFSCDGWREMHKIPEDKGRFGSFDLLADENSQSLNDLLIQPISKEDPSAVKKAKDMYKSCLNYDKMFNKTKAEVEIALKNLGNWPLITENWSDGNFDWILNEALSIRSPPTPTADISAFISLEVYFSENDTSINTIRFEQPSLGLGRDYWLKPENYSEQITAYKTLITKVAKFMGGPAVPEYEISEQVELMTKFESNLAKLMMSPTEQRSQKAHESLTLEELTIETGNQIDWLRFTKLVFKDITNINENEIVFLMTKPYLYDLAGILNQTDNRTLANYQLWRFLFPLLIHISPQTETYAYDYAMEMTGAQKPPDRWKVCYNELDAALPKAVGQIFVKKHFSKESKAQADEMIKYIQDIFVNNLNTVDWMDQETKVAAIDKAKNVINNIGYPEWILDDAKLDDYYKNVDIRPDDLIWNLKNTASALALEDLQSLRDQPVVKTKWYMSPNTVNAYYVPELNSINFPAGILQSPFYKSGRPMALNFGGIGSVIGHEITHGFDDHGRLFDKTGAMKSWWTPFSLDNFRDRTQCYIDQYSHFCPSELSGVCVNGNNTLGENIADNGGIKAAYLAYKKWEKEHGEEKRLPGLEQYSPDQLFFLSFSQIWCSNWRKETLLSLIFKDAHSPVQYRVIGTLNNSEQFAKAFNCPKSDTKTCQLW